MAVFGKITKATQDAVRKTKDFTDVARLNSLISDEQQKITALYTQIGKAYYERREEDIPEPLGGMCAAIAEMEDKISKNPYSRKPSNFR
jgi:hypothetical protein